MRSLRMFALAAVAAGALALSGCAGLGASTPAEATTVAAAEQAYTFAVNAVEVPWLDSGKATKAQAAVAKKLEGVLYADVVVAREAVARNDSAGIAVALKLFNQALPEFTGYLANGGAVVPAR